MPRLVHLIRRAVPDKTRPATILAAGLFLAPSYAALAQDAYPHATETIGNVEQIYDGQLTPDLAVNTFRNIDRLFPTRTIKAGRQGRPSCRKSDVGSARWWRMSRGEKYDLYDYLALNQVTGLIVLKDGKVVYETYQRGNSPKDPLDVDVRRQVHLLHTRGRRRQGRPHQEPGRQRGQLCAAAQGNRIRRRQPCATCS